MYGHYYLVIPKLYTRWMLYYVSNPVMDIPNVIYVYWKHFVTFETTSQPIVRDDSSSLTGSPQHEKFVPYAVEYKVRMTFHELQASEELFSSEYERVKQLVNSEGSNNNKIVEHMTRSGEYEIVHEKSSMRDMKAETRLV